MSDDLDDLVGSVWVACPYCGEGVELLVDAGGGSDQSYVEDCEICCRPWSVRVRIGKDGVPAATLQTLDD